MRQKPRPSAYAWLWAEIERRYGPDVARELHEGYNAQNRRYQHEVWHSPESPASSKLRPWEITKRERRKQ
jgi:hypothetical protein